MSSQTFTYNDVIQHARQQFQDTAQRRTTDAEVLAFILPRVLTQLRFDRPDLWIGIFGTENLKPAAGDPIPFDDLGFNALTEALIAALNEAEDESVDAGTAAFADSRSERARRT